MNNEKFEWQVVLIVWGDKYKFEEIINIFDDIIRVSTVKPKLILISNNKYDKILNKNISLKKISNFFDKKEFKKEGCQTKLCIFEKSLNLENIPTLYLDLDSIILSDLDKLHESIKKNKKNIFLLPATILSFGLISKVLFFLTNGKIHSRGNSSLICFLPSNCYDISQSFKKNFNSKKFRFKKVLKSDDRYISWSCHNKVKLISDKIAVKFPREFMFPYLWIGYIKQLAPWVKKRREKISIITFPGKVLKPLEIVRLKENQIVKDEKKRKLIWNLKYLGNSKLSIEKKIKRIK